MIVYGDDNGSCTIYDLTLKELNRYRERINTAYDNDDEPHAEELEAELEEKKIPINSFENGYVPDYVVELSRIYGFETDSN